MANSRWRIADSVWYHQPSAPGHLLSLAIAGLRVELRCNDRRLTDPLRARYRCYLDAGIPHLVADVHWSGHSHPGSLADACMTFAAGALHLTAPGYDGAVDVKQGRAWLQLSSPQPLEDVDYFLRVAYALLAFRAGGLLFHAAGIVHKERGYLFFGHSGSGKTTVARLSPDDLVLNDDLVLLMPAERHWMVHATPFWNPSQVNPSTTRRAEPVEASGQRPTTRRSAPLAAMFRLVQDREVYLEEMGQGEALAELVASVPVIPSDPARSHKLLELGRRLLRSVPAYRLHFLPDASFWSVVEAQED